MLAQEAVYIGWKLESVFISFIFPGHVYSTRKLVKEFVDPKANKKWRNSCWSYILKQYSV